MEQVQLRIRILMNEAGLSQQQVARELFISYSTLNNYLNGKRSISLQMLRLMSSYFNTSSDYLLGISEIPHPQVIPTDEPEFFYHNRKRYSQFLPDPVSDWPV